MPYVEQDTRKEQTEGNGMSSHLELLFQIPDVYPTGDVQSATGHEILEFKSEIVMKTMDGDKIPQPGVLCEVKRKLAIEFHLHV